MTNISRIYAPVDVATLKAEIGPHLDEFRECVTYDGCCWDSEAERWARLSGHVQAIIKPIRKAIDGEIGPVEDGRPEEDEIKYRGKTASDEERKIVPSDGLLWAAAMLAYLQRTLLYETARYFRDCTDHDEVTDPLFDLVDDLGPLGAEYVTWADLRPGYWALPINPDDPWEQRVIIGLHLIPYGKNGRSRRRRLVRPSGPLSD